MRRRGPASLSPSAGAALRAIAGTMPFIPQRGSRVNEGLAEGTEQRQRGPRARQDAKAAALLGEGDRHWEPAGADRNKAWRREAKEIQ